MSTLNRREMLLSAAALAPLRTASAEQASRVIAARDLLSQESASGYRTLAARNINLIVHIGDISAPRWLMPRVRNGAMLIRELPYQEPAGGELYIRFRWPAEILIRRFGSGMPLASNAGAPIAHIGAQPVAWRRPCGRGIVITLGTLLGPHLRAGDPEAIELASQLAAIRS